MPPTDQGLKFLLGLENKADPVRSSPCSWEVALGASDKGAWSCCATCPCQVPPWRRQYNRGTAISGPLMLVRILQVCELER